MPSAPEPPDSIGAGGGTEGSSDAPHSGAPSGDRRAARRAWAEPGGPLMVEGPVEFRLPSGETVRSDRFMVAICTCRHSAGYPWCDTSHRRLAAREDGTAKRHIPETDRSETDRTGSHRPESDPEKPQRPQQET
ncbi:hypothetical protein SLNWT_6685 [Streptomyces albus]|uniref:Iron-binding zinc finger CDGSH type domain-containing protein n=1 Tax=Streptomyces albus (strain ATCC 21838 / DSM 41398 / FERM P-419 / JCM 4703 / NBRC 107858) TaxID=1081613 RepID=A0A0B5F877_STRA4|nr:hypothetical protein SLNWT_6685 [Streptomyces albus]AOU81365.1 hypothetical protein SLNHY_6674 [Streptomyces albus]AYN37060.1 hypothetical protein DUI70_6567 [Streptomyces albus]